MKERFGRALTWVSVVLYASLGAGCFWRERGHDRDVYVERRHVDHEEHEHEHERHEQRRDNDRH